MDKGFSIQFVSKVTGINAHTIRAWEKRYQAVVPERSQTGKRVYSQLNIDRLKKLHELVRMGNSISDIAHLPDPDLVELYEEYGGTLTGTQGHVASDQKRPKIEIDINSTMQHLVMALRHYKLDIISHELDKIKQALGPRDFALNVLSPLLREVGDLVDQGMIGIAQEHSLSAIIKFHIGHMLYTHLESKNKMDFSVAISTPEGELHEFGIMIAALLCAHYNVNFYYLGPNMPANSLSESCNQIGVKKLILGVSRVYNEDPSMNLDGYVNDLREGLSEDIELWLGGAARNSNFLNQPELTLIPTLQLLDQKLAQMVG